ncbi:selenocysteine lyase/cysteine desulfurase [Clostridium tetanomorphum]|uniref:aminotransferase class V-fold PLP-dependent enzyme n=1 Tax=Clostridium tetanomorphum TaxID=1553 RepID=UPI0004523A66|nr:aminotransferase class V-fold PLP-dependent enzyme [Clostridium tetanomorphum]KAJ52625.1 aminotransferase [Clostridium tetanomorphum DSM 665]MBP1863218.1 selenocysteine lyase/cysteine desulfurase [Clostridium tetanomorphum]NRS84326.1 selenocysteine lyase/cysteine desulfurase [Clostridium tetanomorphum]NRZ97540.1 selenocysteine lyase/cysteine desulfurase [Clostridium tetanomorphum]SQB92271.1 aminotransferase [Clostridium tetanomorphum]
MVNYYNLIVGSNTIVPTANKRYVKYVNFDNAATTPAFKTVVDDLMNFLPYYSSIHRGMGYKSQRSTKVYEDGRKVVADFVGADLEKDTVIFVKNTTEAINKLSNMMYEKYNDSIIISTEMEHHSNDLPWRKFNIEYVKVDNSGRLLIEDLEDKLQKYYGKVKLVTVTGASNVTGYKNSIYDIARIVHKYDAKLLVDGAQLVPHASVNMKKHNDLEHIDYLAFSAHKMYAPFGTGVLIGPKAELDDINPDYSGGGTVDIVTYDFIKWHETPEKDEAGTPNLLGVVALSSAIKTLKNLDMRRIEVYEKNLLKYALSYLRNIPQVKLYCSGCNSNVSIVSFNVQGIYHETLAKILSYEFGIGVRTGCFCAQPYVQKLLNVPIEERMKIAEQGERRLGFVRLSFGLYNTFKEIDYFMYALNTIINNKQWYLNKYDTK